MNFKRDISEGKYVSLKHAIPGLMDCLMENKNVCRGDNA